ncbi:MAG: ABC transporter ATP-binding protein [Alphaproteobacteria bacterium]|nr:ABC transporter ATP-binding protein [Alphaproteobacteria bacterium]
MSCALSVRSLNVRLGRRDVLRDVSFDMQPGEFVGLLGPNGAGKSTLLKAIMGLVAGSGNVSRVGRRLADMTPRQRGRELAYLPQEREVAWPVSVHTLIELGRSPHRNGLGPPREQDRLAVEAAISAMDLGNLRDRSALELSGGERARVLIARALAQETPVLLTDEPAAGLDPAHQIALMSTFRNLASEGRSVLASLHELTLAGQWCDRVILIADGSIVAEGPPDAVLTPSNLATVYGVRAQISVTSDGLSVVPTGLV